MSGSTAGIRVTWNTTLPPECVTSVRVEFRNVTNGMLVASNTTTNTSQTEVVQTGFQCGASYYTRVVVTMHMLWHMTEALMNKHKDILDCGLI